MRSMLFATTLLALGGALTLPAAQAADLEKTPQAQQTQAAQPYPPRRTGAETAAGRAVDDVVQGTSEAADIVGEGAAEVGSDIVEGVSGAAEIVGDGLRSTAEGADQAISDAVGEQPVATPVR